MKRYFSLLLLLAITLTIATYTEPVLALDTYSENQESTDDYMYPITTESEDWDAYTVLEKVIMLQIPDSTLSAMSNDELVVALASYPYLVDIYLYGDSVQDGIEVVRTYCSALNELLERDPELNSVKEYLSSAAVCSTTADTTQEVDSYKFEYRALADIYLSLTSNSVYTFSDVSSYASANVFTPNNTRVAVYSRTEEHPQSYHEYLNENIIQEVYHAEIIDVGSCLYNCHYYAWHLQGDISVAEFELLWMNNPSAYMTDGSYYTTYSGNLNAPHCSTNIRNGDIIFYGSTSNLNTAHSAICVETSITGNAIKYSHCMSKWGATGVFLHDMNSVPAGYDTSQISAWRLS